MGEVTATFVSLYGLTTASHQVKKIGTVKFWNGLNRYLYLSYEL